MCMTFQPTDESGMSYHLSCIHSPYENRSGTIFVRQYVCRVAILNVAINIVMVVLYDGGSSILVQGAIGQYIYLYIYQSKTFSKGRFPMSKSWWDASQRWIPLPQSRKGLDPCLTCRAKQSYQSSCRIGISEWRASLPPAHSNPPKERPYTTNHPNHHYQSCEILQPPHRNEW